MTIRARTTVALTAAAVLALGGAGAEAAKRTKPKVVKAVASAGAAGESAMATAACPKGKTPKGPWRAVSGGFVLQQGDGIVYESKRVGKNAWRATAQSMSGAISVASYVNCQRGAPGQKAVRVLTTTPGTTQIGPTADATCNTGNAVAGGFTTPAPYTPTGPKNVVISSFPGGKRTWRVQVVSNQVSTLTAQVYCTPKSNPKVKNAKAESTEVATDAGALAVSTTGLCPARPLSPGGGGFFQTGVTPTEYLIPTRSSQRPSTPASNKPLPPGYHGNVWQAHGLKVGAGTPVRITAVALCG